VIPRKLPAAAVLLTAVALCGCAERKTIVLPAPPVEIRKETEALPAARPEQGPPQPDLFRTYAETIARTRDAMPRGAVRDVIPLWKALEGTPWGTDAVFHQGVLLQLAEDEEGAIEEYRRLTDNAPVFEPAAANLLGLYLLRGEREKARALIGRILPADSMPPAAMLPELQSNIAAVLAELGDRQRAAGILLALRAKKLPIPSLPWNMAVLSYREGDADTARRLASEIPPEVANLLPVVASRFAWEPGAVKVPAPPDNVSSTRPRMAALWRNLAAYAFYSGGNPAGAESILEMGVGAKDRHDLAEFLTNTGLAEADQGKWKEARAHLEEAVKENPGIPAVWINLGIFREVYEGNVAGALECYEMYVKIRGWRSNEVRKWIEGLRASLPPRQ
jgi:tetratricopeptide (TPR) repeat protein